jgi:hypothetical protein
VGLPLELVSSEDLVELVQRGKAQDPPAWVVWEALSDPSTSTRGWPWFVAQAGELMPTVLSSERPRTVEWSSIWEDHPDLRIRLEIEPRRSGSFVTWRLFGRPQQLEPDDVKRRRYRLNQLINGQLRGYFDL